MERFVIILCDTTKGLTKGENAMKKRFMAFIAGILLCLSLGMSSMAAGKKVNIANVTCELAKESFVYNGNVKKPAVTLKYGKKTLVNKRDYTVKYSENPIAGTQKITITGKNNYTGTITKNYVIYGLSEMKSISTSPANKKIQVSWTKKENASGYQVFRSTSKNGTYTRIATISRGDATSYVDKNVSMGETYYYKVRGYRKINGTNYAGKFSTVVSQRAQLPKVTGVDAVGYTYNAAKITWSKVSGAEGYAVYRSNSKNGEYKKIANVSAKNELSYTDKGLTCGNRYYYKVAAYQVINKKMICGEKSNNDEAYPKPLRTTITNQTVSDSTSVTLKWTKSSGAKGYAIYRNAGDGYKEIKTITSANTLSWRDTGLNANKSYSYKIKSYVVVDGKRVFSHSYSNEYKKSNSGWRYVNGYKLYYNSNGEVVQDVRSLIGKQSSYVIKVNKQQCITTVYAKDGDNGYIIPVVAFICSPGPGTPLGTFYTPAKYRWHLLYGDVYGQWDTRISGHVLFHSVYYTSYNNNLSLSTVAYNKLGTQDSMGCIRLTAGDAKWVYDNCSLNTKVVIYNSSKTEPLKKPTAYKLPSWHTWDPTDPTVKSKCEEIGCH